MRNLDLTPILLAACFDLAEVTLDEGLAKGTLDLSDRIAAQLGTCLRERGADVGERYAKACYDETLWARTLFDSKARGVPLERHVEGYRGAGAFAPPPGLPEAVYRTGQSEAEFRRELFLGCLMR